MGRPRGWSRLYVGNWRVRTKLAAVLLVPSLAFLAVGGLELYSAFQVGRALDGYSDRVALSREVTELVHQVQHERDRTAGALVAADRAGSGSTALEEFSATTAADWRAVNEAAGSYRHAANGVAGRAEGSTRTRLDAAGTALDGLAGLRTAAAQGQLRNDAVFDGYSRIIAALLRVLPDSGAGGDDAAVEQSVRGLSDLAQAKELQSQVRGRLQAVASAGGFALGEHRAIADLRVRRAAALDRFRAEADAGQLARYDGHVRGEAVLAATRLESAALDRTPTTPLDFDADEWWSASTSQVELFRTAESHFVDAAIGAAERFSTAAGNRTRNVAIAVATILLAALATSFVVGRSMAGSLRRLRRRALVAAQHDLPEAIRRLSEETHTAPDIHVDPTPIDTADEIGEVAKAFDAVHRSAVRLASEQAALRRDVSGMFINLARRSQVLVGRQLTLLDELEADEQDPERLSRFFALDHLATRMRRNDENLLVLAASESHRLWREPVPLGKVLLGAVAETEQYQRIDTSGPEDVVVAGHVVPDLLHLLAELLDNATAFSPPSESVQLTARIVRGEAGSEAIISIEDGGMGMTQSMLADANARLAEPPSIDVAVSERMGHFVVSRLAARHGMRVELRGAPGGGVTAIVSLPTAVLAPAPPATPDQDAVDPDTTQPLTPVDNAITTADEPGTTDLEPAADVDADAPDLPEPASLSLPRRTTAGLPRRGATPTPAVTTPAEPSGGWWSGDDSGWRVTKPTPVAPAAGNANANAAGLPVRVPMSAFPDTRSTPAFDPTDAEPDPANGAAPAPAPAEPDEVSDFLSRFHGGVRRANDDDARPHAVTDHIG